MNTPTNLQRFANFMATHPSPEDCVAGRFYRVPCISHPKLSRKSFGWGNWIPLIGPLHEDQEHVGFKPWHIHVDIRFITLNDKDPYSESRALAQPVCFSDGGLSHGVHDDYYLDLASNATIEPRRLQCRRPVPPVFPEAKWASALEKAHAGCRIVDGMCPHRGIRIACGRNLVPGIRQCPGHGLAWDDDGRQVRMVRSAPAEVAGVKA